MPAISNFLYVFNDTCPDPALEGYARLTEAQQVGPRVVVWIGLLIAAEQISHAIVLASTLRRPFVFDLRITPQFQLPTLFALLWAFFTSMSVFLVAVTFRAGSAVLAKALHVFSEAAFLVLLLNRFGYFLLSGIVALVVGLVLLIAFSHDCAETIDITASSGMILDAINFLCFLCFGVTRPDDRVLWLLIAGLAWHTLYLLTFVGVQVWQMDDLTRMAYREAGMIFNIVAVEFFFAASVATDLTMRAWGTVRLKEWLQLFPENTVLPVWTGRGLRLLGRIPEGQTITLNSYQPFRSAYTPRGFLYAVCALFPLGGQLTVQKDGTDARVRTAFLCAFCLPPVRIANVGQVPRETAYVFSWNQIRVIYWLILAIIGAIVGTYY